MNGRMDPAAALSRRALLAGLLAVPLAARAETFAGRYTPRAEPVADGIWLVRGTDAPIAFGNGGAIANCAILKVDGGAALFDCGPSLGFGRALAALARKLTGGPVRHVFISHLHPDHALGAAAFDPAIVAALPATRKDLELAGNGYADAMYRLLSDWMRGTAVTLPGQDLAPGPLKVGGRALTALALTGHSHGDLALLDEATGTLLAGDLVFHDRAPATPDADLAQWRKSLALLAAASHRQLVPGHGPIDREGRAIAQTRDWLDWIETTLEDAVARGLTMNEAGALPIPPRFAGLQAARYELERSISHFYPRIEAKTLPRINEAEAG